MTTDRIKALVDLGPELQKRYDSRSVMNPTGSILLTYEEAPVILAAIEARMEDRMTEWQPIETAPRDGRWVWLWNKHADSGYEPQRFKWSTNYSVFGLGGCWTEGISTMGDKIDFDWWCQSLPADYSNPHAPPPNEGMKP